MDIFNDITLWADVLILILIILKILSLLALARCIIKAAVLENCLKSMILTLVFSDFGLISDAFQH